MGRPKYVSDLLRDDAIVSNEEWNFSILRGYVRLNPVRILIPSLRANRLTGLLQTRFNHGIILMYSIASRVSFQDISRTCRQLPLDGKADPRLVLILVGTKCDDDLAREVSTDEGAALAEGLGCKGFFETSAKRGGERRRGGARYGAGAAAGRSGEEELASRRRSSSYPGAVVLPDDARGAIWMADSGLKSDPWYWFSLVQMFWGFRLLVYSGLTF